MTDPMSAAWRAGACCARCATRDELAQHRLSRGTARRILRSPGPYRRDIAVFLVTVVLDAGDRRGHPGARRPRRSTRSPRGGPDAGGDGGPARADHRRAGRRRRAAVARPSGGIRPASARASSSTCAPRSTTTSSGCRCSSSPAPRPARWSAGSTTTCIGAQRAFTSTLSGVVSNVIQLVLTAGGDVHACPGRSPCCRWCCCRCSSSRRAGSASGWPRSPASPTTSTPR